MPADPVNPAALAASRLGDLPDAGYASRRQKETSDAIMHFMRKVERERMLLLGIVLDGPVKWRKVAARVWRGLLISPEILESIFRYFTAQAGPNPAAQYLILAGQQQQRTRARWDGRKRTQARLRKELRTSLSELRRDQRLRPGQHTVS